MLSASGRELPKHWLVLIGIIWSGQAVSMFTSYAASFAAIWYVTESTGSALALSVLSICAYLPQGLLSPFGGVLADRINRKVIIIAADLFCGIASLLLGIIIFIGEVSLFAIALMVIIRSAAQAFHYPAMMALMPMMVPDKHLLRINTLDQLLLSISGMVAPALGILLYSVLGFHSVMFLDFGGALLACAGMMFAKVPKLKSSIVSSAQPTDNQEPIHNTHSEKRHALADLKEGWVALRSIQGLFVLVILIILGMMCFSPMSSLYPLMTFDYFKGDGYMASVAEATFAAGLLAGSTIIMAWETLSFPYRNCLCFFRTALHLIGSYTSYHVLPLCHPLCRYGSCICLVQWPYDDPHPKKYLRRNHGSHYWFSHSRYCPCGSYRNSTWWPFC